MSIITVSLFCFNLRLTAPPASPNKPIPSSAMVAGSGTGCPNGR